MDIIYFTVTAAILYLLSDRILGMVEARAGRRYEQRTLIFFAILLTLALVTFTLIRRLTAG